MSVSTQPDSKYSRYHSEEEDEGLGTAKVKQSDTFSLYSSHTEKATLHSSESDVRRYDEDSGVCNSSKATDSIDSLSDQDASEGERIGCYDYFPQSQVKIHSGGGLHLDYDEVHEVQSDRSSQDVTSPRSDVEIEMTEISFNRPERNRDADFYTDDESDDDQNIHQSLYSSRSYRADYSPMHKESKEEYAQFFSPNFEGSKDTWGSSAHSGLRSQVDDKISFSSLGGNIYSRYSNPYPRSELYTSSEKVKIEKNFYPNTTSKPPFGDGQDQLEKVGRSIQPLLGGISDAPAPNMPEARKLIPLTSEDNKKKKKKKKVPKDELAEKYEKDSLSGPHDENGNPLESIPPTSVYRQMRESSALGLRGANPSSKSTYGTAGGFPQTINSFDFYQHNNNQIKDLELDDSPSSSKQLKKRKQKKDNKVKEQKSEDIDNYKGNISDIDELVKFIAGNDVGNKKNKKCPLSAIATTATTDIPSKCEKNNKKVKDKKQKSTIPLSAAEENKKIIVIKEGNSDPVTSKLEVHSVREDKDCLDKKMGNSSVKTECKLTDNHQGGTITVFDEEKLASLLTDGEEMGKLNIGSNKSLVISSSIIDLQCPENNKISSIKDKQAESDLVPTANNDIGEVHKNQEDKKWTEGEVEKTDKTVKIESSVNQCVKQKNLKNFKSKSASSSAFVCSDSLTKPISPTTNIEENGIGNGNSPFTVNSDIVDNTFIFTDIDNLPPVPQEDEFQVVGKKKKKVKDSNHFIHSRRVFHSTRISSEEKPLYFSGGKKSFNKQIPVTAIPIVAETDMKQDLSSSSFPALGKTSSKCRKSLPDGRRNSTGEVPIPSEVCVKPLDDSDIESVKSLPLNTDFSDFPRAIVSYASKAASTRPAGNKTSSQASPIPLSKERKEEAKYQVWKGSPTERRHSVGSKPENKSSGSKEPESQLHRTWCGSSETVVIEDDKAGRYTGEESDLTLGKIKSSNRVTGGDGSIDNKQIDKHSTVANDNAFVTEQSNSTLSASSSQSSIGSSDSKPSSVTNLTQTACEKELHKELKPSVHKLKMNNNHKQIIKTATTKTVTNNNNNKKPKQKSVIFLDKKNTEVPAKLDITFGFEPCAEKNEIVQSAKNELPVHLDLKEIKNNSSSAAVSVEADSLSAPNMVIQVSQNSPLITNSSKSVSCVISQFDRSVSSGPSMQTSGKPQTEYKISHIKGINGVVQPSTQVPSQHSSSDRAHNTSNIDNSSIENSKPLNDQEISSYRDSKNCNSRKGRKGRIVTVMYGENVCKVKKGYVPDGSNNRAPTYCGQIGFLLESEDVQGNSNIADAASFLQREWKKVMEEKEQDPSSVTIITV
ncbi:hypothetical protein CHS0354_006791 [Potamilus streckersoni]|uniref:Uncharacterized protein n=1 Tax=Potamilus streckersoni TaxID=2493646 RepID=A0AAE0S8P0_9BIVA|nr:hypothetical protein CHS0354_006791 [Potamilus streckersoni]